MNVRDHATLPTGLMSYHRLEWDGVDATGRGHTGTLGATPTEDYGQVQKCLRFNGTTQYVSVPAHADFEMTAGLTIAFWTDYGSGTAKKLVCKRNNTTIQWSVEQKAALTQLQFLITIGGALYTVLGTTPSAGAKWDHIVARYDGSEISIWTNGVKTNFALQTGSINSYATMPVTFACRCANGVVVPGADFYAGALDDIGIWNRGLTDAEIGDLYQGGIGIIYGDLGQFEARKDRQEGWSVLKSEMIEQTHPTHQGRLASPRFIGEAAPEGLSPEISSIVAINSIRIRVNFVHPATNNQALTAPGNYKITPVLGVYTVTPEGVTNPTYVFLDIDEQEDGMLYQLDLLRIVRA
jgi:hypothetical protein